MGFTEPWAKWLKNNDFSSKKRRFTWVSRSLRQNASKTMKFLHKNVILHGFHGASSKMSPKPLQNNVLLKKFACF